MNIEKIITQLVNKQNQITDPMDFALLGKAIEKLKTTNVFFVNFVTGLPNFASVPAGTLYYVRNEKSLYFNEGQRWLNLSYVISSNVYAFGDNSFQKLGILSSNGFSYQPKRVYTNFYDWCQVSSGQNHSAAIRKNGTLWTWGAGTSGILGDRTTVSKSSPVSVVGGFTDWCQVSAGWLQTLAVRTNGTLWAWGQNTCGILGDGTTVSKSSPVSVVGDFTDWCQVSTGFDHTSAVRQNGTIWSWGRNHLGQLGDGTVLSNCSPISVIGGFTDWCQASAGSGFSAALRQNGTLWTWGTGGGGRLGDNTTVAKCSPVSVVGGFTDWCQVSTGAANTLAIRTNGTLWSWGCQGELTGTPSALGSGTTTDRSSPGLVVGGFTDWCEVAGGRYSSYAVRRNGTLWAWGCNNCGNLGDGTTVNRCSPVSVLGGISDWYHVSQGSVSEHKLAIRVR